MNNTVHFSDNHNLQCEMTDVNMETSKRGEAPASKTDFV
jgi:hypothetical protein